MPKGNGLHDEGRVMEGKWMTQRLMREEVMEGKWMM